MVTRPGLVMVDRPVVVTGSANSPYALHYNQTVASSHSSTLIHSARPHIEVTITFSRRSRDEPRFYPLTTSAMSTSENTSFIYAV